PSRPCPSDNRPRSSSPRRRRRQRPPRRSCRGPEWTEGARAADVAVRGCGPVAPAAVSALRWPGPAPGAGDSVFPGAGAIRRHHGRAAPTPKERSEKMGTGSESSRCLSPFFPNALSQSVHALQRRGIRRVAAFGRALEKAALERLAEGGPGRGVVTVVADVAREAVD